MRRLVPTIALCGLFLALSPPAQAQLGVSQNSSSCCPQYGYGRTATTLFTAALDAAFGGSSNVVVLSGLSGPLGGFFGLMVDLRDFSGTLSSAEATNLATFIATGQRVLIFGENAAWTTWNNSFLGLVGGAASGTGLSTAGTPLVSNSLTAGVTSIQSAGAPGVITNFGSTGTNLFSNPYVALWGSQQNVLTMLDVNTCDDSVWGTASNATFCTNVASWLAAGGTRPPSVVPEPATVVLLATGLSGVVGVGLMRRRRLNG